MIYKKLCLVIAVTVAGLLLMCSCTAKAERGVKNDYFVEDGITFCRIDDVELKLDMAKPSKGRDHPAIVFIFGGAWAQGSRKQYSGLIRTAAERGYVGVSIDYRLTNIEENKKVKYEFPAQIHDAKCAVRWLKENSRKHRIDPERIGAIGWSAGGHLAVLLAVTDPSDGLEGELGNVEYNSAIRAAVGLAAPVDLKLGYQSIDYFLPRLLGGSPDQVPDRYIAASPVTYVTQDDPPILGIYGGKDTIVMPNQGELFRSKMEEVGGTYTHIVLDDAEHMFLGNITFSWDSYIWNFFDEHLK